jgi:hypothetical protein
MNNLLFKKSPSMLTNRLGVITKCNLGACTYTVKRQLSKEKSLLPFSRHALWKLRERIKACEQYKKFDGKCGNF